MYRPNISIIMPAYDTAQYVSQAINSVLEQTYIDWELIIIDDASTDNIEKIVNAYREKDPRIHFVRNAVNKGQTKSLNVGIALAKGKLIARIDADDVWVDSHKLEKQVQFLLDYPDYGLVGTFAYTINAEGEKLADLSYPVHDHDIREYLLIENCFIHSSILMRKDILDKVSEYNEAYNYAQDYDLWLKFGTVAKLHNIPEYMVYYRINPHGISLTKYKKQIVETIQIVKAHRQYYKHYIPGIILWNTRIFLPKNFRESLSRKLRKFLFL